MRRKTRARLWGLAFIAPALCFYFLFSVYPFTKGISLAFFRASVFGSEFSGLANYREMFSEPLFWGAVKNTLMFTIITVPAVTVIPFVIAVMAARLSTAYQHFIRFAFYVPMLSAGVIISAFWKYFFHPSHGLFNKLLGTRIAWLGSNPEAFWSIETILIFSALGIPIILYMAKILGIPQEIIDSAKIDGCGETRVAWHVTFPLMLPIIAFIAITRTIGYLQTWMMPFLLTGGGPNHGTETVVLQIYQHAIVRGRWGYGAAMGVLLMAVTVSIALIQRRVLRGRT